MGLPGLWARKLRYQKLFGGMLIGNLRFDDLRRAYSDARKTGMFKKTRLGVCI